VVGGGFVVAGDKNFAGNLGEGPKDRGFGFPPQKPGGFRKLVVDESVKGFESLGLFGHYGNGT
jgi:hypothetical protein